MNYILLEILNRLSNKTINASHYIGNFLSPVTTDNSLALTPRLEINNIFLDNEERKRFALAAHDYLITQVQKIEDTYNTNNNIMI